MHIKNLEGESLSDLDYMIYILASTQSHIHIHIHIYIHIHIHIYSDATISPTSTVSRHKPASRLLSELTDHDTSAQKPPVRKRIQ